MHLQRSARFVDDAEDGDIGQTNEERAHARRVNFHRGSERSVGVRTIDSPSPCATPGGSPTPLHPAQLRRAHNPAVNGTWHHPNLTGHRTAATNPDGTKVGGTTIYDPDGNLTAGTLPDDKPGNFDAAWRGGGGVNLEHQPGLHPIIQMGARQYSPTLARFLQIDPIEAGVNNDYGYVDDPINQHDLTGECLFGRHPASKGGGCKGGSVTKNPVVQTVAVVTTCSLSGGLMCGVVSVGVAAWNVHNDARSRGGYGAALRQPGFYFSSATELLAAALPMRSIRVTKPANMSKEIWRVVGPQRLREQLLWNAYLGGFGLALHSGQVVK